MEDKKIKCHIYLIGQPDGGKRENRGDTVVKVMMAETDFELRKDINLHIHKAKQISGQ